jgi:hypothetical protein
MNEQYLDENLNSNYEIKGLSSFTQKLQAKIPQDIPKRKRGGLNEITDLRIATAKMLKVSTGQVQKLTTNWTKEQLYDTLNASQKFIINPPALWWKLHKKNKEIYGQKNQRTLCEDRKKRGEDDSSKRQATLF